MLPAVLILAGGGLILFGLWQLRRMVRTAGAGGGQVANRLEELATDLLSAAEEASASLDRRTARLEELLRLADERLAALRQGVMPSPPAESPGPPAPRPARAPRPGAAAGRDAAAPRRTAGRRSASGETVLRPGAADADDAPAPDQALAPAVPAPPPPAAEAAGHHQRVWALSDGGLDEAAIAAELHLPRGEVRLILGLRRVPPALGSRRDA